MGFHPGDEPVVEIWLTDEEIRERGGARVNTLRAPLRVDPLVQLRERSGLGHEQDVTQPRIVGANQRLLNGVLPE